MCGLADIGCQGECFTWQRGLIRERLDCGMANSQWIDLFPNAVLINEDMIKSDHRPLLMVTKNIDSVRDGPGKIRFEAP